MVFTRTLLVLAFCLGGGSGITALDTVKRIDDEEVVGTVTRVEMKGAVRVDTGRRTVSVPTEEVMWVRFGGERAAMTPEKSDLVILASGERYWVKVKAGEKAKLVCTGAASLTGTAAIPFGDVRAWVPWQPETPVVAEPDVDTDEPDEDIVDDDPETVVDKLLALENDRDVVMLINGDHMTGVIESVGPTQLVVSAKVGRVVVARDRIRGVAFSKTFKPYTEPGGLLAEAHLLDGSVVLGDVTGPDGAVYVLKSVLKPTWRVSSGNLRKVLFRGGKLVWLSDLTASKTSVTGFFNRSWPPRENRSVWDNPLTVAGKVYAHGIGSHARTEMTYDIAGRYVTFLAAVAIDDETKGTGSALISVIGDGRTLLRPTPVKGGDKPRRVKLSVAGIRQLTLKVDFGDDQDFGDHVDWLDARLIKK